MRTPSRLISAAILSLLLVLAGCSASPPPEPQTTVEKFAAAISSNDFEAAAALTSDPGAASAEMTKLFTGLGANGSIVATPMFTASNASSQGDAGSFTLSANWAFMAAAPASGTTSVTPTPAPGAASNPKRWIYTTSPTVKNTDQGWRVDWDPAVLAPGLAADNTIRYTPTNAADVPTVLDGTGATLMSQQVVTLVDIDGTADTGSVADLISSVDPTATADSLASQVTAAGGKAVTVITLRQSDLDPIQAELAALPGVTLSQQTRLLTTDRALTSPALSGVTDLWQKEVDAAQGWAVQLVAADGTTKQLAGGDATTGANISTTLDPTLQLAAENALSSLSEQSAIVAIKPFTGAIVAVAQNAAADAQGPIALTGLYPPGSTFKTITTSAALQAGTVTPDTVLPCPGTENIEGRQIPNENNFDLGDIPLHTAFAQSCNTTLGRVADGLPADALKNAALQFGLGIDYVTPGLTTVTGSVPVANTPAERVETGIGQGQVTASPFGMAMVAASIARGSTPSPIFLAGQPATASATPAAVPVQITDQIKAMMREVVTSGTAAQLKDLPDLIGKTGTAEFGDNSSSHGWFIGINGDLAFAVFIAGGDSSSVAVDAAGRFLQ